MRQPLFEIWTALCRRFVRCVKVFRKLLKGSRTTLWSSLKCFKIRKSYDIPLQPFLDVPLTKCCISSSLMFYFGSRARLAQALHRIRPDQVFTCISAM